jgi:hypothetical protein
MVKRFMIQVDVLALQHAATRRIIMNDELENDRGTVQGNISEYSWKLEEPNEKCAGRPRFEQVTSQI